MTEKKITRKVITPVKKSTAAPKEEALVKEEGKSGANYVSKRGCLFCQNKSNPTFVDLASLRRFLTDRAKILSKERSGVCSKHQRRLAKNIKYARHLALLPFVPKV